MTIETLKRAKVKSAGAGQDIKAAEAPAKAGVSGKGRVIVFSYGSETSGIPFDWAALNDRPGVKRYKVWNRGQIERG